MGTSASRFAEPYPASYTVRPSWLAAAEQPGPSFELQSEKTLSRLARVGALGVCARPLAAVTARAAAVVTITRVDTMKEAGRGRGKREGEGRRARTRRTDKTVWSIG